MFALKRVLVSVFYFTGFQHRPENSENEPSINTATLTYLALLRLKVTVYKNNHSLRK